MKITIDQDELEEIQPLPFIQPSTQSVEEQIEAMPGDVRSQVFQLMQTIIHNLNEKYKLVSKETIKERWEEDNFTAKGRVWDILYSDQSPEDKLDAIEEELLNNKKEEDNDYANQQ